MKVFERDAMIGMLADNDKLDEGKPDILDRIRNSDISNIATIKTFANQSKRFRSHIRGRLSVPESDEFANVLRPVFQKDEWKLLLADGVIGAVIGMLQVIFLFGGF